VKNRIL